MALCEFWIAISGDSESLAKVMTLVESLPQDCGRIDLSGILSDVPSVGQLSFADCVVEKWEHHLTISGYSDCPPFYFMDYLTANFPLVIAESTSVTDHEWYERWRSVCGKTSLIEEAIFDLQNDDPDDDGIILDYLAPGERAKIFGADVFADMEAAAIEIVCAAQTEGK